MDPVKIGRLSKAFGARGVSAQRRLASLATNLDLPVTIDSPVGKRRPIIQLDPRDKRVEWIDEKYRVAWNVSTDELQAVVGN